MAKFCEKTGSIWFYLKCLDLTIIGSLALERPKKTAEPRCLSFIFGYRSDLFSKTFAQARKRPITEFKLSMLCAKVPKCVDIVPKRQKTPKNENEFDIKCFQVRGPRLCSKALMLGQVRP